MTRQFEQRPLRRADASPDPLFYSQPRFVTHIDDGAVEAVGALYAELGIDDGHARVLDLMSSWVSHLRQQPAELVVLGMNDAELAANPMATDRVVHDLNADPSLPFADARFDAVLCCVSIDYLVRPVRVLADAARVLQPGGRVVITFSDRCFPTKATVEWLSANDAERCRLVVGYLEDSGAYRDVQVMRRTPERGYAGDPLFAVVATSASSARR